MNKRLGPPGLLVVTLLALVCACDGKVPEATNPEPTLLPTRAARPTASPAPATATSAPAATATAYQSPTPYPTSTPPPTRVVAAGPVDRIVYTAPDGHIYTVNPDGSDRRQVSPPTGPGFPGGQFTWPVWSPDGGTVLFSSVLEGENGGAAVSLVRAPAYGGDAVALYRDDPLTRGIGQGVPHFAMWSPDGEQIALLAATNQQLVTLVIGSDDGTPLEGVVVGAPIYMDWSPDSRHLVVHNQDALFLYTRGTDGNRGRRSVQLSQQAVNYYAPAFAPNDNRFLYVDESTGQRRLMMRMPDGSSSRDLGEAQGILAFKWSPSGNKVAVLRGGETGLFDRVAILDPETGTERELAGGMKLHGLWWSPDGRKAAVVTESEHYSLSYDWSIIDIESGASTYLLTSLPSREFEFVLQFFDQFENAGTIWSPDSMKVVIPGALLDTSQAPAQKDGDLPPPPRGVSEQVWVFEASGAAQPHSLGEGFLAFWSPR